MTTYGGGYVVVGQHHGGCGRPNTTWGGGEVDFFLPFWNFELGPFSNGRLVSREFQVPFFRF